ncbi:MAG: imidazole glycerol phosphate synthase subunit HisH [Sphaerochaetaceae bacterium]|nr:imidazole glycerol phosphate synthase subunit HisH [Sphaerochaetaceae bacterium]
MIAVVDYNAGNVRSVLCALERLGAKAELTCERDRILSADRVIFPGVGQAKSAMVELEKRNLMSTLKEVKRPFLGICLGMQLMNAFSEEGNVDLLSLFDNRVSLFPQTEGVKIPHVGWNSIDVESSPLFEGVGSGSYVYYVHSYYVPLSPNTIARTNYDGISFTASMGKDNFYGCQFHPEKSGEVGEKILKNFLTLEVE